MSLTMRDIYTALVALPCAVTRGWPQALVPMPAIALTQLDDSQRENGGRTLQVELTLRAGTPEAADSLALAAQAALAPLGLRRTLGRDGAQKDQDAFVKTLRYEAEEPGPQEVPRAVALVISGQTYAASLLQRLRERPLTDLTTLSDPMPRLRAGRPLRGTARVRLAHDAMAAAQAAWQAGQPVALDGDGMLIRAVSIKNSQLELELADTM